MAAVAVLFNCRFFWGGGALDSESSVEVESVEDEEVATCETDESEVSSLEVSNSDICWQSGSFAAGTRIHFAGKTSTFTLLALCDVPAPVPCA